MFVWKLSGIQIILKQNTLLNALNKLEIIIQMICTLRKIHFKIICILNEYKHPNDLYITWSLVWRHKGKNTKMVCILPGSLVWRHKGKTTQMYQNLWSHYQGFHQTLNKIQYFNHLFLRMRVKLWIG